MKVINCPFDQFAKDHLQKWVTRNVAAADQPQAITDCTRFCEAHPYALDKHDWPTVLELSRRKL